MTRPGVANDVKFLGTSRRTVDRFKAQSGSSTASPPSKIAKVGRSRGPACTWLREHQRWMGADELVMGPEKEDKRQRARQKMSTKGQNRRKMREKSCANEESDSCGSVNCAMTLCDALNTQTPHSFITLHLTANPLVSW